jgi:hypothetical protein
MIFNWQSEEELFSLTLFLFNICTKRSSRRENIVLCENNKNSAYKTLGNIGSDESQTLSKK